MFVNIKTKFQLFKFKLVYFFLLFLFLLFTSTVVFSSNYLSDYSSSNLVPIYEVQRNDKKIALTIDGAWGNSYTEELLELFAEEEIPVSFFFAGIWIEKNAELVDKIIASGHEIYNHSYSHSHFNSLNKEQIKNELLKTEELLAKHKIERKELKLFRPPYGEYNNLVVKTARESGYQLIQWSLDSHDWMDPGKNYIFKRIRDNINSGEIILFHNNSANIVEILREVIIELKKDYSFVKIEDLIYKKNYTIDSFTGIQYKNKGDHNEN